jgi:hypothetical protein
MSPSMRCDEIMRLIDEALGDTPDEVENHRDPAGAADEQAPA